MKTNTPLYGLAFAAISAIPASANNNDTSLDIALAVGNDGQAVHAEHFHDENFDGGIFKIVDDENNPSIAGAPQTNATVFECFDESQPGAAIEELAEKFIRYAKTSSVEERLAEFELLETFAADWHAEICHDL